MTPEALQVARDAILEAGSIGDVLDLARTMALERVARGLPVAWVGLSPRIREVWARTAWPIDGHWLVGTIEWPHGPVGAARGHHVDWLRRPVPSAEVARYLTLAVALDEATALEQRAADLRRQAKMEEEQAAEASKIEVRIRRALTPPRRVNGMHPAAFDDARMSTEALDAADRARPHSITLCKADALKLATVAECLRNLPTQGVRISYQDIAGIVDKLDSIWK